METIEIQTAEKLLDQLRPSKAYWCTPPARTNSWYFRGHADSRWVLVASIYRDAVFKRHHIDRAAEHVFNHLKPDEVVSNLNEEAKRRYSQLRLLQRGEFLLSGEFLRIADSLALLEAGVLRTREKEQLLAIDAWRPGDPSPEPDEGVALAQHHGIATRLLDWTTSPLTAAWFAASRAQELLIDGEEIESCAVWAVSMLSIPNPGRVKVIVPKRGPNHYLRAQAGAFTWDASADTEFVLEATITSQEQHLDNPCYFTGEPGLVKVVFPAAIAAEVCHLLYIEGLTRAKFMPTLDNVARVVSPAWLRNV